jgi:hypothetical protein
MRRSLKQKASCGRLSLCGNLVIEQTPSSYYITSGRSVCALLQVYVHLMRGGPHYVLDSCQS